MLIAAVHEETADVRHQPRQLQHARACVRMRVHAHAHAYARTCAQVFTNEKKTSPTKKVMDVAPEGKVGDAASMPMGDAAAVV